MLNILRSAILRSEELSMKKRWLYLILLMTIVIVFIGVLVFEADVLNDYSIMNVLKIEQENGRITYLSEDGNHNEFYKFTSTKTISDAVYKWLNLDIGEGQNYLLKLSPKGEVLLMEHIESKFGNITGVVFDRSDNYFLHLEKRDDFEKYIQYEWIIKYDQSGKFLEVVFEESYPYEARELSYVYGLQGGENIYFYYIKGQNIVRYIYKDMLFVDVEVPEHEFGQIIDIVGVKNNATYFFTQDSKLLQIKEDKETYKLEVQMLFDFWFRNEVISGISMDDQGLLAVKTAKLKNKEDSVYMYNSSSFSLNKLDGAGTKSSRIIDDRSQFSLFSTLIMKRVAIWFLLVIVIFLVFYIRRFIKIYMLQQRRVLVIKLLAAFIPIIIISMTLYVNYTYNHTYDVVKDELKNGKFMDFNTIIEEKLNQIDQSKSSKNYLGTALNNIELGVLSEKDFMEISELTGIEGMQVYEKENGDANSQAIDMSGIYRVIDIVKDDHIYKLIDNEGATTFAPRYSRGDYEAIFKKVAYGGEINSSSSGYIFSMRPIYDNNDKIVGIFQVGMNYDGYIRLTEKNLLFNNLKVLILLTLGMIIVLGLIIFKIVLPIGILTKKVSKVDENNLDVNVNINSGDEVEALADAFISMTNNLKEIIENMTVLKDAYYKFVPEEFFKVLEKNDVTDVDLGDNVKLDMCIINSSISNYYEVSSELTKEDNFRHINDYLGVIAPVIRDNMGIIDRYLDRGLIGIFGNDGLNAVQAAILGGNELKKIERLNEHFVFNFGIHRGEMLMGIIGEKERVQTIILSDNVTITSELQELAYVFNSTILATASVLNPFLDEIEFGYRNIGHIIMKGRRQSLEMYDVYESDHEHLRKKKQKTEKDFLQAIEDYKNKKFREARSGFVKVLSKNSDDNIAKAYFYLSDLYFREGVNENWDQTLDLNKVELDSQR